MLAIAPTGTVDGDDDAVEVWLQVSAVSAARYVSAGRV